MKKIFIIAFLGICIISQSFMGFSQTKTLYPVFDASGGDIPRNLRTAHQVPSGELASNFQKLEHLRASGSGQFSENNFHEILRYLPVPSHEIIIVDLRQESHGFINGQPICWTDGKDNYTNLLKTRTEIEMDEYQRLRLAAQAKKMVINPVKEPTNLAVYKVKTERHVVEGAGAIYIRLPVTDHNRPSNEAVNQFIELVKNLSPHQWLHFHCRAGKGRTTTFLTLIDIMKNANQATLDDILARQVLIGGINLKNFSVKSGERRRAAEERLEFIKQFYTYCREVPHFQISWSVWLEKRQSALLNSP